MRPPPFGEGAPVRVLATARSPGSFLKMPEQKRRRPPLREESSLRLEMFGGNAAAIPGSGRVRREDGQPNHWLQKRGDSGTGTTGDQWRPKSGRRKRLESLPVANKGRRPTV